MYYNYQYKRCLKRYKLAKNNINNQYGGNFEDSYVLNNGDTVKIGSEQEKSDNIIKNPLITVYRNGSTIKTITGLDWIKDLGNNNYEISNDSQVSINYFDNKGQLTHVYKGTITINNNKIHNINFNKGAFQRKETLDNYSIIMIGSFRGTRIKSGEIVIPEFDNLTLISDTFISVTESHKLVDYYMKQPIIKKGTPVIQELSDKEIQRIYLLASVKYEEGNQSFIPVVSLKEILKIYKNISLENLTKWLENQFATCKSTTEWKYLKNLNNNFIKEQIAHRVCDDIFNSLDDPDFFDRLKNIDNIVTIEGRPVSNSEILKGVIADKIEEKEDYLEGETTKWNKIISNSNFDEYISKPNFNDVIFKSFNKRNYKPLYIKFQKEIEYRRPYKIDDNGNIYYIWDSLPDPGSKEYIFDTGNDSVTLMPITFFNAVFAKELGDKKHVILDKSKGLDINISGVGGDSGYKIIGYTPFAFRLKDAPMKGTFTVDCAVFNFGSNPPDYSLLIGRSNSSSSGIPDNFIQILEEGKISLISKRD